MAGKKAYFLQNPSGIVFEVSKEKAEELLATGAFKQVTDKSIIAQVGKGSQSKAAGTGLAEPMTSTKLIDID